MFGKKGQKKMKENQISTVIGQGTEIRGDVVFSGGLHIDGRIKGNIKIRGDHHTVVSLSEIGVIEGEVNAPLVILNGEVQGNVYASERIELAPKSKVFGDVSYKLIEMSEGASVNGRLIHIEDLDAAVPEKKDVNPKIEQQPKLSQENTSSFRHDKRKSERVKDHKAERAVTT